MSADPDAHQPPIHHHHQPMSHLSSNYQWEGKPGEGFDVNTYRYVCVDRDCTATAELTYRIPS